MHAGDVRRQLVWRNRSRLSRFSCLLTEQKISTVAVLPLTVVHVYVLLLLSLSCFLEKRMKQTIKL